MYAIVETGGKQYKVEPESVFKVEKLAGKKGDLVILTSVLAVEKMGELKTGSPYINGASIRVEILKQDRGEKIAVFKYKAKKNVRVKTGHRQYYTTLKVKEINV